MKFFYDIIPINEFTYSIKIHGENVYPIYNTIIKMLKSSYHDGETDAIFFSAEKVRRFNQYILESKDHKLELKQCIKMMDDLTKQMT